MEYQNIANLLCKIPHKIPKFITKNGLKFMINPAMQLIYTN